MSTLECILTTLTTIVFAALFVITTDHIMDSDDFRWDRCNNTQKLLMIFVAGPIGWVLYPILIIGYLVCVYLYGLFVRIFDAAGKVDIQIKKDR